MPEKDPTNYSLLTYFWVIGLSILGGVANFAAKIANDHTRIFRVTEFLGEIVVSGFAGLITFWLCEASGINPLITAALVGISGHMGSRAIFRFEKWVEKRIDGGAV